ncbi:hypothetical protein HG535_0F05810 [Zygotorulaspora mrakii]|uniref:Uncharacterized protein n=1 Tax=Zygotorulaspora mrakii TaxID=42260 RepID=A0A7H9B7W1_ZYGMR|nr:uncharacterized protein HG535_0F05810 [Zygotorulaspora mrakii]QLG74069.1 hypothetical protein HG535_0F05810 [Zygotorulaspora mrakii]
MQVFVRNFHGTHRSLKGVSRFIDNSKKIPELRGLPSIYNTKSSASNYKGYIKAKIPSAMYYSPAQSSSSGSINIETFPASFLPKGDSRKEFIKNLNSNDKLSGEHAPPVLTSRSTMNPDGKQYHLRPSDIETIKALRSEDPEKYTRKALAKQFNVSPLFISIVSDASKKRKLEMNDRLQQIKLKWHEKRAIARDDRKKRKEFWYRA